MQMCVCVNCLPAKEIHLNEKEIYWEKQRKMSGEPSICVSTCARVWVCITPVSTHAPCPWVQRWGRCSVHLALPLNGVFLHACLSGGTGPTFLFLFIVAGLSLLTHQKPRDPKYHSSLQLHPRQLCLPGVKTPKPGSTFAATSTGSRDKDSDIRKLVLSEACGWGS